jgi:hypothetical protein
MKKKFILLCTAIIVVITLALLVGCDDSSIKLSPLSRHKFQIYHDTSFNGIFQT